MNCNEQPEKSCASRHEEQDRFFQQVGELHHVICGGTEPQNSLIAKVDLVYKVLLAVMAFILANLITFFAVAFWCGGLNSTLQVHTQQIIEIQQKLDTHIMSEK